MNKNPPCDKTRMNSTASALPGECAVTLSADFLRGVATARHHSTESQAAGAVGAAAVLTAQLNGATVGRHGFLCSS